MRLAFLFILTILIAACSSAPPRPVYSDFMEIRGIKNDDPLAAKFSNAEGEEFRLGDPVVSGKSVARFQVKRVSDDQFDLHVTLMGAEDSRWRRFARSKGRKAALIIDGSVRCVFDVADPGPPVENEVLVVRVPNAAGTQEEADKLDRYLEDNKAAKRKKTEE
ncbi:MAG: hypothetical protein WC824_03065 [Bacteroidota bacterium]|jgi:hypothetical protein